MNKFTLLLLATAAALTSAQCPPNARLCGSDILPGGSLACKFLFLPNALALTQLTLVPNQTGVGSETELAVITPAGNSPANCIFPTNEDGVPQARGACCCADERCFANGLAAICD